MTQANPNPNHNPSHKLTLALALALALAMALILALILTLSLNVSITVTVTLTLALGLPLPYPYAQPGHSDGAGVPESGVRQHLRALRDLRARAAEWQEAGARPRLRQVRPPPRRLGLG